jgi:hypothetical protein
VDPVNSGQDKAKYEDAKNKRLLPVVDFHEQPDRKEHQHKAQKEYD